MGFAGSADFFSDAMALISRFNEFLFQTSVTFATQRTGHAFKL